MWDAYKISLMEEEFCVKTRKNKIEDDDVRTRIFRKKSEECDIKNTSPGDMEDEYRAEIEKW